MAPCSRTGNIQKITFISGKICSHRKNTSARQIDDINTIKRITASQINSAAIKMQFTDQVVSGHFPLSAIIHIDARGVVNIPLDDRRRVNYYRSTARHIVNNIPFEKASVIHINCCRIVKITGQRAIILQCDIGRRAICNFDVSSECAVINSQVN
ncbi:hypothetical protein D3C81_1430020 [compost metagenome]